MISPIKLKTMKKIAKLFLFIIYSIQLNAQVTKVWEGDLYPKDFKTFQQDAYTSIKGDLRVYDSSLTDLSELKSLRMISGNLYIGIYDSEIRGNKYLTSLKGLENLIEISGEITIIKNDLLQNINALKGIKSIVELNISYNPILKTLDGLNNITGKIPKGLQLYQNKRLQDISQLSGITLVGHHLVVSSNLSLQNLEGLHHVTAVEKGYLDVRSNTYLRNLSGLRSINTVDEEVQITGNPRLINLKGLEKLTTIGKDLNIAENETLENLKGLKSLVSIGEDFEIKKNNGLKSIDGINKLSIKDMLSIEKNPLLSTIGGFNQLNDSLRILYIAQNKGLKTIKGFNNIAYINSIKFSENHLESIIGFNNLKTVSGITIDYKYVKTLNAFKKLSKVQYFRVEGENVDITDAFKNLRIIEKKFSIYNEDSMRNFKGINSVVEIGSIVIEGNKNLISFTGFNNLKVVNKKIIINENNSLQTIPRYNNLELVKEEIDISHNSSLHFISGFNKLTTLKSIRVDFNRKLYQITGFKNLKHIDRVHINGNKIRDLNGFNTLTSVGNIYLSQISIEDLTGFINLQKVDGHLDIDSNYELESLKGLENLTCIGGDISITNNDKLIDYKALQDKLITSTKKIEIYKNAYNPSIDDLLIRDHLDTKVIPESYLKNKTRWWLSILRNEIFARKGYVFGEELTEYFTVKGWYIPKEEVKIVLNDIEKENVKLIKKYEQIQIDKAQLVAAKLKEKYKNNIDFTSDYKKYYPMLKKFIKAIDIKRLARSNKLIYSKYYDFDKNEERNKDNEEMEDLDNISIDLDDKEHIYITITDNHFVSNDDDESWLESTTIYIEFKLEEDASITFVDAYEEDFD